jgi:Zn-dependent protease
MKCQKCGQEIFLPFRCQYCGGYFCPDHRLQENHECPQMDQARMPKEERQQIVVQKPRSYEHTFTYPTFEHRKIRVYFSYKEIKHLTMATLLVIGVGLSLLGFQNFAYADYFALALFVAMFTTSFIAHEIAHKIVAQRNGLWAEFRLILISALLTLLSIVSPIFKVIAPGAVMISGSADKRTIGKVSIAGPATNIVLGATFLAAAFVFTRYSPLLAPIAYFNAWIALFNLIPFAILDGLKIFNWNKKIWALAFATSIALAIVSYPRLQ